MSGHSEYSREGKNLVNLFDLFSRHSVGLKKKKKRAIPQVEYEWTCLETREN